MKFTFENQGTNTYLVYEIGAADELDTMTLGMLTNNTIPGFAEASFTQMDTTKYIKYNVSAKVSVSQLFGGAVNKKRLVGVFSGIIDAMLSAEDYMIDTDSLLLDLDYIFADVSTCETQLVCLPVMNRESQNANLSMFFKNIIFSTQFDQTENCDHVAQILNYLNSAPVLSLYDFKELLNNLNKAAAPAQVAQPRVPVSAPSAAQVQSAPVNAAPVHQTPVNAVSAAPQQPVIPNQQYTPPVQKEAPAAKTAPVQSTEEKPMSMFYLLQHYNKENAALYKAQKDSKKSKADEKNATAPAKRQPASQRSDMGFAIPGQSAPVAAPPQPKPPVAPPPPKKAEMAERSGKTPAVEICSGCGTPLTGNYAFCGQCGTRRGAAPAKTQPAVQPAKPAVQPVAQPVQPAYVPQPAASAGNPINFGQTTVLSAGIGQTTVLSGGAAPSRSDPHLVRIKNNEKIPINKPVFRIGKEKSYVDYFIGDNTAISRSHANIVNHNEEFFVVDTNSTNHTYVNGGMIQSNTETKLSHGTKIRLANEDFEFKMY